MSIVLDALSKAETESQKGIFKNTDRKINDIKTTYKKYFKLIIIFNCIIIFGFYYLLSSSKKEAKTTNTQKIIITPKAQQKQKIPEKPKVIKQKIKKEAKKTTKKLIIKKNYIFIPDGPHITIAGVFEDSKGSFILVNEDMFKKGDKLQGATINKITMKKVTIEFNKKVYEIPC